MTILYKPVLIETVEQAEELPLGTIASVDDSWTEPAIKRGGDYWSHSGYFRKDSYVVDWYALIPIEVPSESIEVFGRLDEDGNMNVVENRDDGRWYRNTWFDSIWEEI